MLDVWRCASLARQESEESGCAILPGNAAYLEAEVVNRLEAGDHWLVYAKVNAGKVLPPGVPVSSQAPPLPARPRAGVARAARRRPRRAGGGADPAATPTPQRRACAACLAVARQCDVVSTSCGRPARVQVVQEGALSAVHHRKVGTTY
jgi:hypothetical protein